MIQEFTVDLAMPAADAARAWRSQLPRERRLRSYIRGCAIFALSAVGYVGLFLGMFLLPTWWARLLALSGVPLAIGGLFVIGHDACHNTLTPSGWLNRILGRLAMLPAFHPYTSWAYAHNTLHHAWTNFKGRHPDFPPLSKEEYDNLSGYRKVLERIYRSPLGVGLNYAVEFFLGYLIFPQNKTISRYRIQFELDRLLVVVFIGFQFATGFYLGNTIPGRVMPLGLLVPLAVFVPWMIWIWFMGFVSYLQHTHPRIAWYDNEREWSFYHVQLKSTTHVVFPWPIERLLNNIMDHPAHHLDPAIPLYELPPSQKRLEEMAPAHSVVIPWSIREYFRICRVCKLYDYRKHCWLDFQGNPTTPSGLNGQAFLSSSPDPLV